MFSDNPPTHHFRYGLLSIPAHEQHSVERTEIITQDATYYLLVKSSEGIRMAKGSCSISEHRAILRDFDELFDLESNQVEELLSRDIPYFDHSESFTWDTSRLSLGGRIPQLHLEDMNETFLDQILGHEYKRKFWSNDWSTDFYIRQARMGMISTSYIDQGETILLPELQFDYALLKHDWLIPDKGVEKIRRGPALEDLDVRLVIQTDPNKAIDQLQIMWEDRSWLTEPYVRIMNELSLRAEKLSEPDFRPYGVLLMGRACEGEEESRPIAGELGYTVGKTYTSLSGFFHRGQKCWNHFGKLQLYLLADHLHSRGIELWNLGHPYMDYKTRMGARITPREQFIPEFLDLINSPAIDISTGPSGITPGRGQ